MNEYVKNLIAANKNAVENIKMLEVVCATSTIENEKDKANFGNACIALKGYRMIADATEAMLINEDVVKDELGNFYQKIDDKPSNTPDPNEGKANE